jgi:hypothetical protein
VRVGRDVGVLGQQEPETEEGCAQTHRIGGDQQAGVQADRCGQAQAQDDASDDLDERAHPDAVNMHGHGTAGLGSG